MRHAIQCRNMVEQQIRPWDVLDDRVLDTYYELERDTFLPGTSASIAYADAQAPIGHGQHALEPKVEARILQELAPRQNESILHVGTGSGFFAALLSRLCASLVTIEIVPELARSASKRFRGHNLRNIMTINEDFFASTALANERYDAVVLTGSIPRVSPALTAHLADRGRVVAPIGVEPISTVCLLRPADGSITREELFDTWVPPLANAPDRDEFVF